MELPQRRAHKALQTRRNTVCTPWGRGGGKSWFCRLNWYLKVQEWDGRHREGLNRKTGQMMRCPSPGVRITHLMPTLEQSKKVHADLLESELETDWAHLGAKIDHSTWRIRFPGGSYIQWLTAERASRNRGLRCDLVTGDEADDIPIAVFDAIVGPWFSEPHSLGLSLIAGTPTKGRHGLLYRTHARGIGKLLDADGNPFRDHFSFHATAYDFPHHIDFDAVEKSRRETPTETFKREWLCDFDAAEGLVYPDFSEGFHVREPEPGARWQEYIIGADWGYNDPLAINVYGVAGHGKDVTIHQLDEFYETEISDTEVVDVAKRLEVLYPNARWYADPSRPGTIRSLRNEALVNIVAAENDIKDGLATVRDVLFVRTRATVDADGEPINWAQLYVSPTCVNTIREFGMYRNKRLIHSGNAIVDEPEDKNNHAMDAMRYAIHTHFGGPSGRIREGLR